MEVKIKAKSGFAHGKLNLKRGDEAMVSPATAKDLEKVGLAEIVEADEKVGGGEEGSGTGEPAGGGTALPEAEQKLEAPSETQPEDAAAAKPAPTGKRK
ncbi:MAG TPA: hypothetical protein VIM12_05870 [Noviherbaspirillum sp.]|uniref:hypothetical protein n=1 Tax=Noviherbaspirillum sp. TaxID=1926288 RepID=UPI002F92A328